MRKSVWLITVLILVSCESKTPQVSNPIPVESSPFSSWPTVTKQPVQVSLGLWGLCRNLTPEESKKMDAEAKAHGPHARYSIIVRANPEAVAAFRNDRPLPTGAVVVKEKYMGMPPSGRLQGYAVMTKREAGYYPDGGDWEYEYVNLRPERKETRGRLANCATCHASAKERDFLFRSYGNAQR
jgi:hypothetical protein